MKFEHGEMCPRARREGLVVKSIDNEVLVYDEAAQRAHCLNRAAALVWGYCDGTTPIAAMARRLASDLGGAADDDVVYFALRQLGERDLLEETPTLPSDGAVTRRQLLARLGAAAALVPVVTSLLAPRAASAQSGGGTGSVGSSGVSSGSGSGSSGSDSGVGSTGSTAV